MTLPSSPHCPVCGSAESTYKVSSLYLALIARVYHKETQDPIDLNLFLEEISENNQQTIRSIAILNHYLALFSPPSGNKKTGYATNPDLIAGFFVLISIFMGGQLWVSHSAQVWIVFGLLFLFLLGYALSRNKITAKYRSRIQEEIDEKKNIEAGIKSWMSLYCCSKDQVVFDAGSRRVVPMEEIFSLTRE
jgi:hypothetical protein